VITRIVVGGLLPLLLLLLLCERNLNPVVVVGVVAGVF
jgi:hypothetical protein